ncbi:MAG: DUF924 domain-containing protein [Actinomycetota bacterium]|nr:DUF924 domain-containing protein [Actinomycetota bacterium]
MAEESKPIAGDPEEVLSYWFPEEDLLTADAETFQRQVRWWMRGGPEVDREIVERFGGVLEQARRGELDHWAKTPRGRLALIVVLDQFSRNAYRGSALSYAQDEKALRLAVEGIEAGMDRELRPMERDFFWMPIVHSEDVSLHRRHVGYVEELASEVPPHLRSFYEFRLAQARAGVELMERFGRYPHRNEVLGRISTPEELEYLRTETPLHLREPPRPT